MADAIGALARVDLAARGLSDLGKPDGWGERQVPRWRKQLDGYGELPGYPGPAIPRLDDVAALARRAPPDRHPDGADPRRLPLRQRADRRRPTGGWRRSSTGS